MEKAVSEQFRAWEFKKGRYLFNRRVREALQYIPDNSFILDIGCGDSESIITVESSKSNVTVIGIDIRMLPGNKRCVCASCAAIPFKDNMFDCVLCLAVLEHTPHQLKVLTEISRVLKDGGFVIITTPNPFFTIPSRIAASLNLKHEEGYDNPLTIKALEKLLALVDIHVVERRGFLLLPFKNPFERLEGILGTVILGFTMLMNQIVVGKKSIGVRVSQRGNLIK